MKELVLDTGEIAYIDDEDYPIVKDYEWHSWRGSTHKTPYARKNTQPRLMHRFILGNPKGRIDHVNGNTLDNRKENLRSVTQRQNQENRRGLNRNNTTGVRGVIWDKDRQKYKVQLRLNYRSVTLGRYDTLKEAEEVAIAGRKQLMTHSHD